MNRQRIFFLFLVGTIAALAVLMLAPFTGYLLAAAVLGFVLYPGYVRLRTHLPDSIAAGFLVLATILAAILPALIAVGFIAGDAAAVVQDIQQDASALQELDQYVRGVFGQDFDLRERVKGLAQAVASRIANSATQITGFAANLSIGLSLMLFVQYYVMRDGERFVSWTKKFDVMPTDLQEQLYQDTAMTTWAVIKGHIFVAVVQGLIAGVGLFLVGIPNAAFWTFIMVLLGFIPLVGTAFVWVPAAGYLALTGNVVYGIGLLLYGVIVVGLTDNFARPLLVDEEADIHEVFILTGIVGGVLVFGAIGIFIGPILFGVLKELLELYQEYYDTL